MTLAQEKGASNWLSALPLEAFYTRGPLGMPLLFTNFPIKCPCGANMSVEHALSCPKEGMKSEIHLQAGWRKHVTMWWLNPLCNHYWVIPWKSNGNNITDEGARLDIVADGFWGEHFERAYFNFCVFNPLAPSNGNQSLQATYRIHKRQKKWAYDQQIREIEHGSFTPLVMSAMGGISAAGNVCIKRIASLLTGKWDLPYSCTLSRIRCKLEFSLLRSAIQYISGSRSSCYTQRHPPFSSKLAYSESGLTRWLWYIVILFN